MAKKTTTKPDDGQFDMIELKRIQEYHAAMVTGAGRLQTQNKRMRDIFFMQWKGKNKLEQKRQNLEATISPDPRNRMLGAIRLMISSDPYFSIPYNTNDAEARGAGETIEKAMEVIWTEAGNLSGTPLHFDQLLSGFLYGQAITNVTLIADLIDAAKNAPPAVVARLEAAGARTPFLYTAWNPEECYWERDKLGLRAFSRSVTVTSGEIMDDYGDAGVAVVSDPDDRYESHTLTQFWDLKSVAVWVDGKERPILMDDHGLKSIPVDVTVTEGSQIFDKLEEQVQPFLYTLDKTGLWRRQNLALTVFYWLVQGFGMSAQYVANVQDPTKDIKIDWDNVVGIAKMGMKESLKPLDRQIIDPVVFQGMEIANDLVGDSTIYPQSLGRPLPSASATWSLTNLLSQTGRLPLIWPRRKLQHGMANVMRISLEWLKDEKRTVKLNQGGVIVELKPADIPDNLQISCKLEINLPQDKLELSVIANNLAGGDDPLVSKRFVREDILKQGQSGEMTKEIWMEKATTVAYNKTLEEMILELYPPPAITPSPAPAAPVDPNAPPPLGPDGQPLPAAGPVAGPVGQPNVLGGAQNVNPELQRLMQLLASGQIDIDDIPPELLAELDPRIIEQLRAAGPAPPPGVGAGQITPPPEGEQV